MMNVLIMMNVLVTMNALIISTEICDEKLWFSVSAKDSDSNDKCVNQ